LDERLRELTGFRLDEETPLPYAKRLKVPNLMAQFRRDFLIHGEKDGQAIFDALGAQEKNCYGSKNRISASTRTTISGSILNRCSASLPSTCEPREFTA
jgi:hypothetical protein